MSSESTAIVLAPRAELGLVRPIARPVDMIQRHKEVTSLIAESLEQGTDYGVIPGTGAKPALLKPGAERLAIAFGASPDYVVVEQEIDHDRENAFWDRKYKKEATSQGLYRYVVRCSLVRQDGMHLGSGLGSCSTLESKYISRPRDCENTALKMACKRALVAAVLNAFGLSDRFTQDVEEQGHVDEPHEEREAPRREPARAAAKVAPSKPKPRSTVEICEYLQGAEDIGTLAERCAEVAPVIEQAGASKDKVRGIVDAWVMRLRADLAALNKLPDEPEPDAPVFTVEERARITWVIDELAKRRGKAAA